MDNYKVYIKTSINNHVIAIEGGLYPPQDPTDWICIDGGTQDPQYTHPQGNYFDKPLFDEKGCQNYKYIGGKTIATTEVEKQAELVENQKRNQIPILKAQLATTDYMVIKQSEAKCLSIAPLPYTDEEMGNLHKERQAIRNKINELEGSIIV